MPSHQQRSQRCIICAGISLKRHYVSPKSTTLARYAAKKRKVGTLAGDIMERSRDDSVPVAIGADVPSSDFPLAGGELRRVTRTTLVLHGWGNARRPFLSTHTTLWRLSTIARDKQGGHSGVIHHALPTIL